MKTQHLIDCVEMLDSYKRYGKVKRVIGLMIESKGPESSIGDVCLIHPKGSSNKVIKAEVVGFQDENILLMPYLEAASISPGSIVEATGESLRIKVGAGLIGQVIDAFGEPMDGKLLPIGLSPVSTDQAPPNP
ncbi:flagellum-specific ATP synthase FliI, partial [Bacillus atrophaeus]|nr:flagellum-specific ATP synthase FliI [Bacillus atrophaeus]